MSAMSVLTDLRPRFLARTRREKLLAVLFLVALVLIWLSSWWGRVHAFRLHYQIARSQAEEQERVLEQRSEIESDYEAAVAALSGADLPTRDEVFARVQEIANRHGLNPRMDVANPDRRERLTFHTINVTIDSATWDVLLEFQRDIATTLPTVNLARIKIDADRRKPENLTARLRLVAIEFNR